jgi:Ca2+-binding EF-hand superfamily protein
MLVRELLELSEGWEGAQKVEKEPEIKKQLKEIKDQDPSGYIKINKFWYSAEKKLNKYFDKQVEEQLKEENPE